MDRGKSKGNKSREPEVSVDGLNTDEELSLAFESLTDMSNINKLTREMPLSSNNAESQKSSQTKKSLPLSRLRTTIKLNRQRKSEEFQRSRYLSRTNIDMENNRQQSKSEVIEKKKRPSCWATTTLILTFWTPSSLLRACGKRNQIFQSTN